MTFLMVVTYVGKIAGAIASILAVITYLRPIIMEWWRSRTRGIKSFTDIINSMQEKMLRKDIQAVYDQYIGEHKWDWRPKVLKTKKHLRGLLDQEKKKELMKKEPRELIISTEMPKQKFQVVQELELTKEEVNKKFEKLQNELIALINKHVPTGYTKFDHKWAVIRSQIEPLEPSPDYINLLGRRTAKFKRELEEALKRA
jgi:septum formation topological specificity factor MinE